MDAMSAEAVYAERKKYPKHLRDFVDEELDEWSTYITLSQHAIANETNGSISEKKAYGLTEAYVALNSQEFEINRFRGIAAGPSYWVPKFKIRRT